MTKEQVETVSGDETEDFAAIFAARLRAGDVVLLAGDVGTGKTTFVRGAGRALGIVGRVTSPSFAIGAVYDATGIEVAHLDLYRLDSIGTSDGAVIEDFVSPQRITFIEWPHDELVELDRLRAIVTLRHVGGDSREIEVEWVDERPEAAPEK